MKIHKIYLFLPVSRSKILRFLVIFFFFFLFRYFMKTFSRFFDKRILKILCKSTVKNRRETVPPAVPFFLCKSIFIQNDGERSIITELNFHIGSEFSGSRFFPGFFTDISAECFIQRYGMRGLGSSDIRRAVSFFCRCK